MNGYGHFVLPLFWSITYWLVDRCVPRRAFHWPARRGAEDSLERPASHLASDASRDRFPLWLSFCRRPRQRRLVLLQHPRPERIPDRKRPPRYPGTVREGLQEIQHLPQPKITAADAKSISIPTAARSPAPATSSCRTRRRSLSPQIHITNAQQAVSRVAFDRPFHVVRQASARCTPSMPSTSRSGPASP